MSNVTVPVDIEDVKQACMNYSDAYNLVEKVIGDTLKTYEETIIQRKLFGFIPWFNTTQFDKMNFYGKHSRPFAMNKLKRDVKDVIPENIADVVEDYFVYRNITGGNYTRSGHIIFKELKYVINEMEYTYGKEIPASMHVSTSAFNFIRKYRNIDATLK
ncbi:hypothetical protein vBAcePPAc_0169 [Aeromonas phage vB_AceP_PAc]|nr:hypothetical protein vBAcePPAc_0169 [Aeromonas phage vB_AceP_PAc]